MSWFLISIHTMGIAGDRVITKKKTLAFNSFQVRHATVAKNNYKESFGVDAYKKEIESASYTPLLQVGKNKLNLKNLGRDFVVY